MFFSGSSARLPFHLNTVVRMGLDSVWSPVFDPHFPLRFGPDAACGRDGMVVFLVVFFVCGCCH